jgi:predicted NBD/HSP70 family sugar kinase
MGEDISALSSSQPRARRTDARWRGAEQLLTLVRREPEITRASAARRLGLNSGTAAELIARLRELSLIDEQPAAARGRGRPTAVLRPHVFGPLVAAIDVRHADWRIALAGVDGVPSVIQRGRITDRSPAAVLDRLRAALIELQSRHAHRLRAVSIAVPAATRGRQLVHASTLSWRDADVASIAEGTGLPVLIGNDATLAGVAEARTPDLIGARILLHLVIEVGLGGVLIIDGEPVTGATGTGGEFGHLPFGDRRLQCPCGARGCWELEIDGRAMARHLAKPTPHDPRRFAEDVIAATPGDAPSRRATQLCAAAFGAGVAGLINALDPEIITLGGLAGPLRQAAPGAFDAALTNGMMEFRRTTPPVIRNATWDEDGALRGAATLGLDTALDAHGLERWAEHRATRSINEAVATSTDA